MSSISLSLLSAIFALLLHGDGVEGVKRGFREISPISTPSAPAGTSTSANLRLSGQPADCENGSLNGEWIYQGNTADGKKYYMRDTEWDRYGVLYLFFDKDGDAGTHPEECSYNNYWLINMGKPSTTALQDLDGDKHCLGFGFSWPANATGGRTPPTTGEWRT